MTGPDASPFLPCGTNPETLLQQVAERTPPRAGSHEAGCAYCLATLDEYRQLWEPVRLWAARDIDVPRHFAGVVMHRVRRIVQSPRHVATASARGYTTVTSWVLGLVASTATLDTPGVAKITGTPIYANRAASERYGADGVEITETGATDIIVTVGVTAVGSVNLPSLADRVRQNIIAAISDQTHMHVSEVDLSIDDIDLG